MYKSGTIVIDTVVWKEFMLDLTTIDKDIFNSLKENIKRLNYLCKAFDSGQSVLANDISNVLWVLCEKNKQLPLLEHKIDNDTYISNYIKLPKMINKISINGLQIGMVNLKLFKNQADTIPIATFSRGGISGKNTVQCLATRADWELAYSSSCEQQFHTWWKQEIVLVVNNECYSRYKLVKNIRHNSGAHTQQNIVKKKKYKLFRHYLENSQNKEWECIKNINDEIINIETCGAYFTVRAIGGELIKSLQNSILSTLV